MKSLTLYLNECTLNESKQNGNYIVLGIRCSLVEDSYKDGEKPGTERNWDEDYNFSGNSIKEVINKVLGHYDMKIENAVIYNDDILVNKLSDKDGLALNSKEHNDWKEGKYKGYSHEIRFKVYSLITHDQLEKETDIESYD